MTKTQAVDELRQALSKVSRDLKLFAAGDDPQAADHTWGALAHDMAVLQTTWDQMQAEHAPPEVKIIGPYPSAAHVRHEIAAYAARGWQLHGPPGTTAALERTGGYYFARVTRPRRRAEQRS